MTLYSAIVSRICFSVIIICVCIKMFIVAISSQDDNGDLDFMLNRIIMWFLTVIGTWVGIGFKCEGRIEKEKKKKKMRKHVSKEEYMGFWIPIIVCLIFLAFLVFKVDVLQSNPIFMNSILLAAFFFMVFVFALLQAYLAKYKPSEKQSKKILENAFKTRPRTKQHFGRMVYFVKDNTIYIYKDKKIVYPGHEKDAEFIRLFGKKKIPMHDYNSVESEFVKRYNEQKEYIDCEIKKCISDRKDSLVDNAHHYDLNKI